MSYFFVIFSVASLDSPQIWSNTIIDPRLWSKQIPEASCYFNGWMKVMIKT
jgi:hypothetical protein